MECGGFILIPWECHCPSSKLDVPCAAALLVVADGSETGMGDPSTGRPESTGAEALALGLAPRTESEAETGRPESTGAEAPSEAETGRPESTGALAPTLASEDEGTARAPPEAAFRATAARTTAEDV